MNGLYSLRRKPTQEYDSMMGPIFPNVPGSPPPQIRDVSQPQPDETQNSLLNAMKIIQALKGQPEKGQPPFKPSIEPRSNPLPSNNVLYDFYNPPATDVGPSYSIPGRQRGGPVQEDQPYFVGEGGPEVIIPQSDGTIIPSPEVAPDLTGNTLRNLAVTNPNLSFKNFITPSTETTPSNALLRATTPPTEPVAKKPVNSLLDYWAKPVIGKMPLDQFVQIAGALSSAIAPREWSGRVGNVLSQMGGAAYAERVKREGEELERQRKEPENILRRRLLEAQITEAEIPREWGAFSKSLRGAIDPDTKEIYKESKILQKFHEATRAPKEPTSHVSAPFESGGKMWQTVTKDGKVETIPLIPGEIRGPSITTEGITETTVGLPQEQLKGKEKEVKVPTLKEEFKNINGIPHKRQIEWNPATKQWSPKGDWIRTEKPEKAEKPEKLTLTDVKTAYSMDIGNIKNQMMTEMTPNEQITLSGTTQDKLLDLWLAGKVGKSLPSERKKYYIDRLQKIEKYYGDLTNEVLRKKGVKIPQKVGPEIFEDPQANLLTDIEYEGSKARGKMAPGPGPSQEIFKDKQGKEMIKDPTSSTGWRYR